MCCPQVSEMQTPALAASFPLGLSGCEAAWSLGSTLALSLALPLAPWEVTVPVSFPSLVRSY